VPFARATLLTNSSARPVLLGQACMVDSDFDTGRFRNVTISDDSKSYSIVAFALAMAHLEIAKTGNDGGDATAKAPARDA
jgi:hypothetical protein